MDNLRKASSLKGLETVVAVQLLFLTQSVSAFYCPQTGRWLSRDPIGERGGANLKKTWGHIATFNN
jgi:hypothetical protein